MRRRSALAERLATSMRSIAAAASAGCASITRRAAAAWIPIAGDLARQRVVQLASELEPQRRARRVALLADALLGDPPTTRDEPDDHAQPRAERQAAQEGVLRRSPTG